MAESEHVDVSQVDVSKPVRQPNGRSSSTVRNGADARPESGPAAVLAMQRLAGKPAAVLAMQRFAGNRAVGTVLQRPVPAKHHRDRHPIERAERPSPCDEPPAALAVQRQPGSWGQPPPQGWVRPDDPASAQGSAGPFSAAAAQTEELRVGQSTATRLGDVLIPSLRIIVAGGKPPVQMAELEARSALRRIEQVLANTREPPPSGDLAAKRVRLQDELAELKRVVDALAKENAARVSAPAAKPVPAAARTYTKQAAGPDRIDFGKVSPGTQGFSEAAIFNLTPYTATVATSYQGDSAIQIIRSPQYCRERGVPMTEEDRNVKLLFNAPPKRGSFHGTLLVSLAWAGGAGGPAPETLTIPVVAHALDPSERIPEEQATDDRQKKREADQEAALAKRRAQEDRDLEAFSKAHPRVATDRFHAATDRLGLVINQVYEEEKNGVETAQGEVMKYKQEKPPSPDTLAFDFAMLVMDVFTAGIAGRVAKRIEIGLKDANKLAGQLVSYQGKMVPAAAKGLVSVLSEPAITGITDSVKESIKGTSKLVRKHMAGEKADTPGRGGTSIDHRLAFFQAQRTTLNFARTGQHEWFARATAMLLPTVLKNEPLAIAAVDKMTEAIRDTLPDVADLYTTATMQQWIKSIANLKLDTNRVASVEGKGIGAIRGVVDIGFEGGPNVHRGPVIVRTAILRGVSNAAASRFWNMSLLEAGLPVRAYGVPGGNNAELLVTVTRSSGGAIKYVDQTQGAAPGPGTWLKGQGTDELAGARYLIEQLIMSKSLTEHGVTVKTDQDPSVEGD